MHKQCSVAYHIYNHNKKNILRDNLSNYNLDFYPTSFFIVYAILRYGVQK